MASLSRWLLVVCVLAGLLGQLVLQGQARPDETPRATFERLTGLSVGPAAPAPAISGMDMPRMDMAGMGMATMGDGRHAPHHHDDGYCPLCPLLHLPMVVLGAVPAIALTVTGWRRMLYGAQMPRAPPRVRPVGLPPPTGPPAFSRNA
ncbi:DUF2946 family protein [Gluconacetobacter tumulisoli]|uniref:DUF2946 domain-containing protein n=1 Tax=Gluconacetobacter tumulisoli TaxID=1286189 RepID=A0A7W4K928_9PROT|nr:DUF2946 family protein [Gluconacetobacter tumulisoli]MBB2202547.1 DUF2946 domain-containing protein [Gluconacetobacter tumulisoli]